MSFVRNNINQILIIIFLLLITIFFRTYKLDKVYSFEWDQERDAEVINSIVQDKKPVLIGPRVVSDHGFFTGPYHYYYLLPFYILLKGHPIAGAYGALLIELITVITIYIVCNKIFGLKVAFFASFLYSLMFGLTSWNVMYTPLFSVIIFYLCYLLINKNNRIFPLLIIVFTFGFNNHPSLFSLIIPIIYSYISSSKKIKLKTIFISGLLFMVIMSPLLVFDMRHDFLNTKGFLNFVFGPKAINLNPFLFLRSYWRGINLFYSLDTVLLICERILILMFALIGIISLHQKKLMMLIAVWIITPLLFLSIYRGDIPEYYYSASLTLLLIMVGVFFAKIISLRSIPIFAIVFVTVQSALLQRSNFSGGLALKNKINVIEYIVNQKEDSHFNVSYDLPLGMDSGYKYLFKYLGKEPIDSPEAHLYSIILLNNSLITDNVVYRDQTLGVVRR